MNEAEDITIVNPRSSKYEVGKDVVLKNGSSGKIIGSDPVNRTFLIMTASNHTINVKGTEIDKAEKPKDHAYQVSGVNPEIKSEVNIKDTPFDLNLDK